MRLTNGWGLWTAIAGAILVVIGSSGEWVTAGSESVSGLSRDGAITAVTAVVAILILALAHIRRWALITSGVIVIGAIGLNACLEPVAAEEAASRPIMPPKPPPTPPS
jgi:hypothetical protein